MGLGRRLVDGMGRAQGLEAPADWLGRLAKGWTDPRPVKNALSGTWLGHRLHPMLTDVVIGSWLSAAVLDLIGDRQERGTEADVLIGLGLVSAVPTVASGLSDYADLYDHGRRIAFVHSLAMLACSTLQAASLVARRNGRRGLGEALSLAALGTVAVGSHLGGHLSYVLGVGVDHTAFHEGPKEWTQVALDADLLDGPCVVRAQEQEVLLARVDGRIVALDNRCSHAGQPIGDGQVRDGCITCPYHGSRFRLADGAVVRGPAASPQLRYEVRVRDGVVEVRGLR